MKPEDVMRQMVRDHFGAEPEFTGNRATDWGEKHEPVAIKELENLIGELIVSTGLHTCESHPFLGASPDGLTFDAVAEVKCPYSQKITTLEERPDYYAQVQIEMLCTGKNVAHFFVWTPEETHYELVGVDYAWQEENLPRLIDFHIRYAEIVADETLAAPYLAPKSKQMESDAWRDAEARLVAIREELAPLLDAEKKAKSALVELARVENCTCKGEVIQVIKATRKGTLDADKIEEMLGIDCDIYRKPGSVTWTVR